jgi:hypothetical protein
MRDFNANLSISGKKKKGKKKGGFLDSNQTQKGESKRPKLN